MSSETNNDLNGGMNASGGTNPNDGAATPGSPAPAAQSADEALPTSPDEMEQLAQEGFADDGDFAEHYRLLFASTAIFVGTMYLPIEGHIKDLYAKDCISGGFLAAFSAYGILAAWMNIHNRKMIMWPMLFAAMDGLYLTVRRELQLIDMFKANPESANAEPIKWVQLAGPGLYVIFFGCLIVLWTLVTGVAKGAKKAKARQEVAKANRAARKGA